MVTSSSRIASTLAIAIAALACADPRAAEPPHPAAPAHSHAIYAEFARDSNKLMANGLNRRVFNTVEAQAGSDIALGSDGAISLEPGTYRITGFSIVTMQATFGLPKALHDTNYPGYCLVYPKAAEAAGGMEVLKQAIAVGSPQTALDTVPSLFDVIYTTTTRTEIAVGHQSGEELNNEVYLSVYEVEGIPSDDHLFARIAITKL